MYHNYLAVVAVWQQQQQEAGVASKGWGPMVYESYTEDW